MAIALLLGFFDDSLLAFFPTNSGQRISEVIFEHYQVWYEGIHDVGAFMKPSDDKFLRACSETLAADILGIFEDFGIASVDGKPFEVLGMVEILEREQEGPFFEGSAGGAVGN